MVCMLSAVCPFQHFHSLTVRRVRTRQLEWTLPEYRQLITTAESSSYTKWRRELIFCNESDCTLYRVYWLPPSSTLRHFIIPQRSLTFTPSELQPRHFLSDAGGNQPCLSTWAWPLLPNNTNTQSKQGWLKFRQYHTGDTDHTVHLIFEWTWMNEGIMEICTRAEKSPSGQASVSLDRERLIRCCSPSQHG